MTSSKAKRKRNGSERPGSSSKVAKSTLTPPPEPFAPRNLSTLVSDEELEVTIETLQTLTQYPALLKSKACRDLRVAVFNFRQACSVGAVNAAPGSNLTARISAALVDENYTDAMVLLAEMRIRGETPKLGALCRWVRDLDVVSGLSLQREGTSRAELPRPSKDVVLLRVLDAIFRVTGMIDTQSPAQVGEDPICLQPVWHSASGGAQIRKIAKVDMKEQFRIIETTAGADRKPPNLHPALLYLSESGTIPLEHAGETIKIPHPVVPNLFIIQNLLSAGECADIVAACESVGFTPDAPMRDDGQESSVLAHNVYWLVDEALHDALFERVRAHLPSHTGNRQLRGINRRFRVYRYVRGAEYRCHVDGAWPPSGLDAVTQEYRYDASPAGQRQSSLFTFLIYLNDDFGAGETTFFMPSMRPGVMNAFPVRPVMGSVLVFPHGEASGALLHEGTGVTSGTKYIVRTDVEYDVDPAGAGVAGTPDLRVEGDA
jgi:hypothetical protein